jgi:hypothetical protein
MLSVKLIERAPNADYQVRNIVIILIFGVLVGAKHMSHMAILRTDEVLRALFKWEKFPVFTTLGRIFKLFTPKYCKVLSDAATVVWKKSYHPLFCFIAENQESFHNWFCTGNAFSANGSVEFIKECFAKLSKRVWKIFVRADNAFFDEALLDLLEAKGCQYLIKVKMKGLTAFWEKQSWRKIKGMSGYKSTKFEYQCA